MAPSRIFIGNLQNERIERMMLFEHFKKYGNIIGVSLHKGFGFVQFTGAAEAQNAVRCENGAEIGGCVIDCKIASEGRSSSSKQFSDTPRRSSRGRSREFSPPPPALYDDYDFPCKEPRGRHRGTSRPEENAAPRRDPNTCPQSRYADILHREHPLDCLVIATDPSVKDYAQLVAAQLKAAAGLITEVVNDVFNDGGEVNHLIDQVAQSLIPISILLTPVNFRRKSATVSIHYSNILEEHRNVALEDAIALVVTSYSQYSNYLWDHRHRLTRKPRQVAYPGNASPSNHKRASLLHSLQSLIRQDYGESDESRRSSSSPKNSRDLSVVEMDEAIDYLQQKRRKLVEQASEERPINGRRRRSSERSE